MTLRRTDPRFVWDEAAGRYRYKTSGRLVEDRVVRSGLEQAIRAEEQRAREIARAVQTGEMTPGVFQREMTKVVTNTQYFSAAAALGGWDAVTTGDANEVERKIDEQLSWLRALTTDLRAGLPRDGSFFQRAASYARAGRSTFFEMEEGTKFAAGMTRLRNVIHPADHCEGEGSCLEMEDLGWMPIGDPRWIPPGQRKCRGNCLCTVEYDDKPVEPGFVFRSLTDTTSGDAIIRRPSSVYPVANPDGVDTMQRYTRPDGKLTPERQRLWDSIIRRYLTSGVTPSANQVVYVMGGGPAAGKSSMRVEVGDNALIVDPDKIKELLPEFDEHKLAGDIRAGSFVQEESSTLAKEIVRRSIARGYTTLVDGTGDNTYEKLAARVAEFRATGAKVVGNYVTLDYNEAVKRMIQRAEKIDPETGQPNGRYVPTDYMREVYRNIANIIPRAAREGLYDELNLWDNNGPAARIIATYKDGQFEVLDQAKYDRFLDQANLELADVPALQEVFALESRTATARRPRTTTAKATSPGEQLFDHDPHWEPPPEVLTPEDAPRSPPLAGDDRAAEFSTPVKTVAEVGTPAERADLLKNLREMAAIIDKAKKAGFPVENPSAMVDVRADEVLPSGSVSTRKLTATELKLIDDYFAARADLKTTVALWMRKLLNEALPADMPKPRAIDFETLDPGTGGETNPETKDVRINSQMLADFGNLLAGARTAREWGALQTIIHEEFHVASPMENPVEYMQRNGAPTEELLTEAAARRATDAMFGVGLPADRHQFGGYRDAERAIEELERVKPGTIDRAWSKTTTDARSLVISDAVGDWLTKDALPLIRAAIGDATTPATPALEKGLEAILAVAPADRPLATTNDMVELWWKTMPKVLARLDDLEVHKAELERLNALDPEKLTSAQQEELRHYRALADEVAARFVATLHL